MSKEFVLITDSEKWVVPRNSTSSVTIKNPTKKWMEVRIEGGGENYDFWLTGEHCGIVRFVMAPDESKELILNHRDLITGTYNHKKHDRRFDITHCPLSGAEEAEQRKVKIDTDLPMKDGEESLESGYYINFWSFHQKLSSESTGSLRLEPKVHPEPPVTPEELKKDPTPRGAPKRKKDKITKIMHSRCPQDDAPKKSCGIM